MPTARLFQNRISPFLRFFMSAGGRQQPIVVDGRLNENSWKKADWTENFSPILGRPSGRPGYRTRVNMLWDDSYFYIAAECEEPHVWATVKQRDGVVFEENDFEIFIDPDGDTHNYCELEFNALNTVWDLLLLKPYRDGGPAVGAWDIGGMKSAVSVNGTINDPRDKDKGWLIEVALPWPVLREIVKGKKEKPDSGDQWRVNFSRVEYPLSVENGIYVKAKDPASGIRSTEEIFSWSPQGVVNMHYPEMWGYVAFSDKLVGKGKELFADSFDEPVKWALRKIYYREKAHQEKSGCYAAGLDEMDLEGDKALRVAGWKYPPLVQITESQFEALFKNEDGEAWHIRQDGLVWKTESAKP